MSFIVNINDCYDAFKAAHVFAASTMVPNPIVTGRDGVTPVFKAQTYDKTFFEELEGIWKHLHNVTIITENGTYRNLEFVDQQHYMEWFLRWG